MIVMTVPIGKNAVYPDRPLSKKEIEDYVGVLSDKLRQVFPYADIGFSVENKDSMRAPAIVVLPDTEDISQEEAEEAVLAICTEHHQLWSERT